MTDAELLASYASSGSERAFAEIVSRYAPMVYSACRRTLGEGPDAEDAAQATFLVLVRKAASLPAVTDLPAWLYRAARYAAEDVRKQVARRKRHEREAMTMRARAAEGGSASWEDVQPQLDAALAELPGDQLQALVLRYLCGLDPDEVARRLGTGPDAAAKRTTRALDWLRRRLARRGVTVPAAGLGAMLAGHAVEAVPAGLVGSIQAVCSGKAAATGAVADLAKGAMKMMFWAKVKVVAAAVAAVTVVGAGGGTLAVKFTRWGGLAAGEPAAAPAAAGVPADLALSAALLDKTGIKGGLCLVLGAKDTSLAAGLAAQSALYVQALQPDAKLAAAWGAEFARQECQEREKLGLRNAAFDPVHYDSDLFNLIVVEDAGALGKAKLADLYRILVPNGFAALKGAPESFAAEAKTLKMDALQAGSFQAIFKKPVLPVEWKPGLARKWSAEPNDHNMDAFTGITCGDGRFFYRERMEVEGERWKEGRFQLFARDAYNGRMLWTREEPVGWDAGARTIWWRWLKKDRRLAADNKGRLFAVTSEGKLVCLDAATGKQRFVLMENGTQPKQDIPGMEENIKIFGDRYVIAYGKVFSAEDGKLLWTLPKPVGGSGWLSSGMQSYGPYKVDGDSIYFCDGKELRIAKLADGQMQTIVLSGIHHPEHYGDMIISGRHLLITTGAGKSPKDPGSAYEICSIDKTSGKALWSWTAPWPGPTRECRHGAIPDGDKLVIVRGPLNDNGISGNGDYHLTRLDLVAGKTESEKTISNVRADANFACSQFYGNLGHYWVNAWAWLDGRTLEYTACWMKGGACSVGQIPADGAPLIFVMPDRKGQWITCDASVATERALLIDLCFG